MIFPYLPISSHKNTAHFVRGVRPAFKSRRGSRSLGRLTIRTNEFARTKLNGAIFGWTVLHDIDPPSVQKLSEAGWLPGVCCHTSRCVLPRSRVSTATSLCQLSCLQPRLLPRVFVKFSLLVSRLYCILVYLVYYDCYRRRQAPS